MKTQVKFEVIYQSVMLDKIGTLMSGLDLGITGIKCPQRDVYEWITATKVDIKYIAKMKKAITAGLVSQEMRVISIKKIK